MIVLGFGTVAGAVYVAVVAAAVPPPDCGVEALSTPQAVPLQPGPDKDHESAVLGLDPGRGVKIVATVAVEPVPTLAGADTVNEKLLVIVIAAEACLEGSATLCAVNVSVWEEGRICGATNRPLESTEPHADPQPRAERLQRTAVSGCPPLVIFG